MGSGYIIAKPEIALIISETLQMALNRECQSFNEPNSLHAEICRSEPDLIIAQFSLIIPEEQSIARFRGLAPHSKLLIVSGVKREHVGDAFLELPFTPAELTASARCLLHEASA